MNFLWLKMFFCLMIVSIDKYCAAYTLCAYSKNDIVKYHKESTHSEIKSHVHSMPGNTFDINSTIHCNKGSDSCYILWQEDPLNKSVTILLQGCWDTSSDDNCNRSECVANSRPTKARNNTLFCCCTGNFCNKNITEGFLSPAVEPKEELNPAFQYVEPVSYSTKAVVLIAMVSIGMFCFLMIALYLLFRVYYNGPKRSKESLHLVEAVPLPAPTFDLDNLKVLEAVGHGRFGSVCRGTIHDRNVAVKIFSYQNRQYFLNELDIYTLPYMDHPSLLHYIGSEERMTIDGHPEYLLVLQYSETGCLQDFLKNSIIDWTRLCKMALSVVHGLAYLHTEFGKGEKRKPCIAHRDISSRNILIKNDGNCMICDFGFALRISGSKYYQNGEEVVAETTSLSEVGTWRYMAPEILEGAVNLRDCETSLKQIDVYSVGLIIWELATRCSDLFQGLSVPEYKMPYEEEVGLHPTMEQMQILVSRRKARPLFPDIWKDTNPAIRSLKETIEECWDQDSEARLTTLCVEERLSELPVLWERYKAGLSVPVSISPNSASGQSKINSNMQKTSAGDNSISEKNAFDSNGVPLYSRERVNSLSEDTTETLLSPSEPSAQAVTSTGDKNVEANNLATTSKVSVPLQPHQGRNPCLERNLILEPLEELTISGNILVESECKKTVIDRNFRSLSDGDADIFDAVNIDHNSLTSGDFTNHSIRIFNPIPYLQNAVHAPRTVPKQPNVPGNGHSLGYKDSYKLKDGKHWSLLNLFSRRKREKGLRAGLKSLLDRKLSSSSMRSLSEEKQPLQSLSPVSPVIPDNKLERTSMINNNWTCDDNRDNEHLVDTEVLVKPNQCTIVRPLNNAHITGADKRDNTEIIPNGNIAKTLENDLQTESDSLIKKVSHDSDAIGKCKRPTTLPVQKFQNIENTDSSDVEISGEILQETAVAVPMRRKGSNGKRKGVKRVKTPFEIKGRFSLYDDRIMSSQEIPMSQSVKSGSQPVLNDTKFSASVPLDMNTLCATQVSNAVHEDKTSEMTVKSQGCVFKPINGLKLPVHPDQQQVTYSLCDF